MLELYLLPYEFNNPFYLPPGVTDEMVAGWRKAFDAAVADKAYQADAAKRRQTVTPRDGADVEKLVSRMFAIPPDIVERTIKATTPK
jgi:tripartite-type tricarboxylate transporter receptor subunit TctC